MIRSVWRTTTYDGTEPYCIAQSKMMCSTTEGFYGTYYKDRQCKQFSDTIDGVPSILATPTAMCSRYNLTYGIFNQWSLLNAESYSCLVPATPAPTYNPAKAPTPRPSTAAPSVKPGLPTVKPHTAAPTTRNPTPRPSTTIAPSIASKGTPTKAPSFRPSAKPSAAPEVASVTVTISINQILKDISVNKFNADFTVNSKIFSFAVVNSSTYLQYSWMKVNEAVAADADLINNIGGTIDGSKDGLPTTKRAARSAKKVRMLNAHIQVTHQHHQNAIVGIAKAVNPASIVEVNPLAVTKSYAMIPYQIVITADTSSDDDYYVYDDDGSYVDLSSSVSAFINETMIELTSAVDSGSFTAKLNYNALVMGSKNLANVTVGSFVVTDYTIDITSPSSKSAKKTLSAGGIAGIVIACVVVVGLAIGLYFFLGRNKSVMPQQNAVNTKVVPVVPGTK